VAALAVAFVFVPAGFADLGFGAAFLPVASVVFFRPRVGRSFSSAVEDLLCRRGERERRRPPSRPSQES